MSHYPIYKFAKNKWLSPFKIRTYKAVFPLLYPTTNDYKRK
jgi:hypothetical protein